MRRRIEREQEPTHLIAAMPAIISKVPHARLLLVGRGDRLPQLRAHAEETRVANHVHFPGYRADVPDLMALHR
ncbi:glycosyltransferase family 4 protein [Mariniluteicoccus endophyticus]